MFHHCNNPGFSGETTLGTHFQTFSASRARVDRSRTDLFLLDVDFDVTDYRRLHDSAHCTFDDNRYDFLNLFILGHIDLELRSDTIRDLKQLFIFNSMLGYL